ncbi:MAG: hypothetical protein Q9184_006215, partial [Pyrenodesmia sp. 2 TL-2023]
MDGDSDCDTNSSYSRGTPDAVGNITLPSDLKHQIVLNDEPPNFEVASQPEKMTVLNAGQIYKIRPTKHQDLITSPNAKLP